MATINLSGKLLYSIKPLSQSGTATTDVFGSGPHRYWRLLVEDSWSSNYVHISELEFYDDAFNNLATSADNLTVSSVESNHDSYQGEHLVDGNTTSYWRSENGEGMPQWARYDFGSPVDIIGIGIGQSQSWAQIPKTIHLEASDNDELWMRYGTWERPDDYSNSIPYYFTMHVVDDRAATIIELPAFTSTGEMFVPTGTGTNNSDQKTIYGFTVSAEGGESPADVITLPGFTSSGVGLVGVAGEGEIELPEFDVNGVADSGITGSGDVDLPAYTVSALDDGSFSVVTPKYSVDAAGATGNTGALDRELPAFGVSATLQSDGVGTTGVSLGAFSVASDGVVGQAGSVDRSLPKLALEASGVTGVIGTASVTLPVVEVDADIIIDVVGTASIELPSLFVTARAPDPVAASTQAFQMNLLNRETTPYSNFPFNSFATFNGVTLAASSSGIFALSGATDNGTEIDAYARLKKDNMGSTNLKRVTSGYVGYQTGGDLELVVTFDDQSEAIYQLVDTGHEGIFRNRVKLGKGHKGNYVQLEVRNVDGVDFDLDSLELAVEHLRRKVS
jgi:F5/8 type C domain